MSLQTVSLTVSASAFVVSQPSLERSAAVALAELEIRALPANEPNGYTPTIGACPSDPPTIRTANALSPQESSWLEQRRPNTIAAMSDLLSRVNISGFDAAGYLNTHKNNNTALPNIGIAASGGGYRAMLNGAGGLAAFDSRTDNANATGHLGGLLQSATYLAGLSGGSWLVGSLYGNNNTRVQDIMNQNGQLWDFTNSILEGPDGNSIQILDSANYYRHLFDQVEGKSSAGFNTTLTDYW
jgi:lysophospholipase